MDTLLRERQCAVEHIEKYIPRELDVHRAAAIILPLGHALMSEPSGA